jgi:hypothetical protein
MIPTERGESVGKTWGKRDILPKMRKMSTLHQVSVHFLRKMGEGFDGLHEVLDYLTLIEYIEKELNTSPGVGWGVRDFLVYV